MREPFDVPGEVVIDIQSGYAINLPLGPQDFPGWQESRPDVIKRILKTRKEQGIVVEDDLFIPRVDFSKAKIMTARTDAPRSSLPKRRKR